jgi:hypothetical protein
LLSDAPSPAKDLGAFSFMPLPRVAATTFHHFHFLSLLLPYQFENTLFLPL